MKKCVLSVNGKCTSDYNKNKKCDGKFIPIGCPYKIKEEQQEIISAIKRANIEIFDIESKVFDKVEEKLNYILKWAKTSRDKRKSANLEWTSSPERQIGYLIEGLEYEIKEFIEKEKRLLLEVRDNKISWFKFFEERDNLIGEK